MIEKIDHISCVLIVKDAFETLGATLDSLAAFDDVVVYDNGSSDGSQELAKQYDNVQLIEGEFFGFGKTKQHAATFAKYDWIFSLDADEVPSSSFIDKLRQMTLDENCVYKINRVNYYKETQVKHCWGNDSIVRLYNRQRTDYNDSQVHELVKVAGFDIVQIKEDVKHYPYVNVEQFIEKLNKYSTLFAEDNVGRKRSSPVKAIFNAQFSFVKTYFFKRGFLDGSAGLLIAFSHMATNFYKYMKLYELNKAAQTAKKAGHE